MATETAAGIISLLEEPETDVKSYGLQQLDTLVDEYWMEIANHVSKIESLYEDTTFPYRDLAALVASKVYYHLGEFSESLTFALGANDLFDINSETEYVRTLIGKCIDEYTRLRVQEHKTQDQIDKRLQDIVEKMFDKCFRDGEFKQALGMALETRRIDKFEECMQKASQNATTQEEKEKILTQTLGYVRLLQDVQVTEPGQHDMHVDEGLSSDTRHLRMQAIDSVRKVYEASNMWFGAARCALVLKQAPELAHLLSTLLYSGDQEKLLTAYQIAFDLYDNAPQHLLRTVREILNKNEKTEKLDHINNILSGKVTIELNLQFLKAHNNTDFQILKNIKAAFEPRLSVYHNSTVMSNAIMNAGTANDAFLREDLDWMKRASNWAKFSATASLGVIYKGQIKNSLDLLSPYLVQDTSAVEASPYVEGGALYAAGLINSNHYSTADDNMTNYLLNALRNANKTIVQHGACLGLGLVAMATEDGEETCEIFNELKNILYNDDAIAGEAAGVAMGMVMLGAASQTAIQEMLTYAHDTQHEKIIRGISMGLALSMYGREQEADSLIEQLTRDKDGVLRYGGMYCIGLAYSGTSSNTQLGKLLHFAVSDLSDDVRRAAVINMGFLLINSPEKCPRIVRLLAESYNPNVRYGATMAIGIACAGTGLKEAVDLLWPLTKDGKDFVRQGALIALAMVLMQQNDNKMNKVNETRELFTKVINTRHEETMCKFGAILATGIIDAGGRNVSIELSRNGNNKMRAIVGMAMFTQYWFWYPYMHFLSLCFQPTNIIGLNSNLQIPKFKLKSNTKKSTFAYPPKLETLQKTETATTLQTAVLSTTAKAKQKEQQKLKAKQAESGMEIDETEKKEEKTEEKPKKEEPEPDFEVLQNPARVVRKQLKSITFDVDDRYTPLKKDEESYGIVMLRDKQPGQPEELVDLSQQVTASEENEPEPPEEFEWQ